MLGGHGVCDDEKPELLGQFQQSVRAVRAMRAANFAGAHGVCEFRGDRGHRSWQPAFAVLEPPLLLVRRERSTTAVLLAVRELAREPTERMTMDFTRRLFARIAAAGDILTFDNRLELLVRRALFPGTRTLTYRLGSLEFIVDHAGGDATGTRACLVSQMYRNFLPQLDLRGPISVLDIGANGGGFPLMLRAHGLDIGSLTAVEMNPRTFARMQLNVSHNLDAEFCLIHGAVTGVSETLELHFGRGSTGESLRSASQATDTGRAHTIQGHTLDEVIDRGFGKDDIDLCKIDIEGAEYDVFEGPHHQALRQCRYLIMEIHDIEGRSPDDLRRRVEALGFRSVTPGPGAHADVFCFERTDPGPRRQS